MDSSSDRRAIRAREVGYQKMAYDLIDIADGKNVEWTGADAGGGDKPSDRDRDVVQRDRLRQRIRVSQALPADARRHVARAGAGVRNDGDCSMPRSARRVWARKILALDRRRRPCGLPLGLHDGQILLSHYRRLLKYARPLVSRSRSHGVQGVALHHQVLVHDNSKRTKWPPQ